MGWTPGQAIGKRQRAVAAVKTTTTTAILGEPGDGYSCAERQAAVDKADITTDNTINKRNNNIDEDNNGSTEGNHTIAATTSTGGLCVSLCPTALGLGTKAISSLHNSTCGSKQDSFAALLQDLKKDHPNKSKKINHAVAGARGEKKQARWRSFLCPPTGQPICI